MGWLADNCPRLSRAHRAAVEEALAESRRRRRLRAQVHRAEALVAHRELQLVRAWRTGSGGYIDVRQRKLTQAQQLLTRLRGRLDD
jgi:hypothetical protein